MEAEEDDYSKDDEKSLPCVDDGNLDAKCDTHRELQSNEEQHCVFKSSFIETEFPPNTSVESSPPRDAVLGAESLAADSCSEMEKNDVVEETEIAEEKDFRNIIEDVAEDSVKLEIEPGAAETALLGQRVFADVKEDTGEEEEEEEKAVTEFVEGELLQEMVSVGVAENQVEGKNTVVEGAAIVGCAETTEKTCLTDVFAEETLAETTLFAQDVDVADATNLSQKTEVEGNADDPKDSMDIKVSKQENFAMKESELGVPVQLAENSDLNVTLVDEDVEEGRTANLADRAGEILKTENVSSTSEEVRLAHFAEEIDEGVNIENAEDKAVQMDGMCMEDKANDVAMMENLADETPEIKRVDIADYVIEVLKSEDVEDREAGAQGLGVADESAEVGKIENMVDEAAEDEGVQVTDYTEESENMEEDKTAQVEEIAMAEETAEADDMVYLLDEGIGSEETDANMTYMVEETEATEEVEEMDVTEEVDEPNKGSSGAKRKRGKNPKAPTRVPSRKKVEEDVCFICFDGGDLVLCDRRLVFQGHPK